jgi:hypothetical protein
MDDIIAITLRLASVCEQLGIRYLVGGSLASSLHGIPRATQDVDLVIEIGQDDVAAFAKALRDDFFLDEAVIRFQLGDRVADRQWQDALGVLKVAGTRLDFACLRRVSALLGVGELLASAAREMGPDLRGNADAGDDGR